MTMQQDNSMTRLNYLKRRADADTNLMMNCMAIFYQSPLNTHVLTQTLLDVYFKAYCNEIDRLNIELSKSQGVDDPWLTLVDDEWVKNADQEVEKIKDEFQKQQEALLVYTAVEAATKAD